MNTELGRYFQKSLHGSLTVRFLLWSSKRQKTKQNHNNKTLQFNAIYFKLSFVRCTHKILVVN